jgi:hypothetical protein
MRKYITTEAKRNALGKLWHAYQRALAAALGNPTEKKAERVSMLRARIEDYVYTDGEE